MQEQTRTVGRNQKRLPHNGKASGARSKPDLAQQYGGRHSGRWVSRLPESWIPYVQLARLSPPAGLALIYFPHLFGALLAAVVRDSPPGHVLRTCAVLLPWSLFFSNAAHAWNDLVDAPLDAAVARTRQRPIPRGAVSARAAFTFAVSQALLGIAVLYVGFAGREGQGTALYVLPNAFATVYYPYAKRHTHFAQFVLGFCLAWGVVIGWSPAFVSMLRISPPAIYLTLACVLWTAIYDTIYAHQDLVDDKRLGLRSLAVMLGDRGTKPALSFLLCGMVTMLVACATSSGVMGWWPYLIIAPGGCVLSLGCMIAYVNLKDSSSCWWWFGHGFWTAGFSMAGALATEYIVHRLFV
ncbi:UbiA prenyltransferase family-domain-containing protein [Truncatella angustata]|uniref:UbiA prenyltransferase family-domain-containing protein n=1 Tax=Truncatella angustata TaxID=152316 RepID=A0A9P8UPR5_9PEZI|nr:UbiA prenyltransferase family-domain-containing protein [Truncatella angustata]KAH6655955.1 UbiA prenyltransferase family-domain-containing protein [Truncatella angustata]